MILLPSLRIGLMALEKELEQVLAMEGLEDQTQ
jgi:hypothetical protein